MTCCERLLEMDRVKLVPLTGVWYCRLVNQSHSTLTMMLRTSMEIVSTDGKSRITLELYVVHTDTRTPMDFTGWWIMWQIMMASGVSVESTKPSPITSTDRYL